MIIWYDSFVVVFDLYNLICTRCIVYQYKAFLEFQNEVSYCNIYLVVKGRGGGESFTAPLPLFAPYAKEPPYDKYELFDLKCLFKKKKKSDT